MAKRPVYDRELGVWMDNDFLDHRELTSRFPERYSYTKPSEPKSAEVQAAQTPSAPPKAAETAPPKRKGNPQALVAARAKAAANRATKANGAAQPHQE
jgi:hypothetical protein